jgi:hypothetical protein
MNGCAFLLANPAGRCWAERDADNLFAEQAQYDEMSHRGHIMVLKHEMIPPEMNPISSYDPMHFAGQEALQWDR